MKGITRDWLLSAEMDLKSIGRMLDDEFLAPVACFHAQQCVERSLKAILEERGVYYPKTHDILRLYGLVSGAEDLELDLRMLQVLNDLYIDARYPGELGLLPHGRPTLEDARQFYEFAADVYRKAWKIITGGNGSPCGPSRLPPGPGVEAGGWGIWAKIRALEERANGGH